ncbi:hypothetical protein D9757_013581 [Collybiopsis confluens]|uniref:C2H2-type domain-containing protein n=1 Tax=Collybiopsis confluens TaxID=2823264 RepID=A0A8H5GKJ8_9AGAR|nr:hypothetical protein D9757_013581 [Collybiopsis confluens]
MWWSNFVCGSCYVQLPSLHDLYDHLDAAHHMQGPSGATTACQWPPKVPPLQAEVQCEVDDRSGDVLFNPRYKFSSHLTDFLHPHPHHHHHPSSIYPLILNVQTPRSGSDSTFAHRILDSATALRRSPLSVGSVSLQLQPGTLPPQLPVFVTPDGNRTRRRSDVDQPQPQPQPGGLDSERVDVVDDGSWIQPRDFDLDLETKLEDEQDSQI